MRYVVDPKRRRAARSFIYAKVFERLQEREDIQIGSDTMSVTVQPAKGQNALPAQAAPPAQSEGPGSRDNPRAA